MINNHTPFAGANNSVEGFSSNGEGCNAKSVDTAGHNVFAPDKTMRDMAPMLKLIQLASGFSANVREITGAAAESLKGKGKDDVPLGACGHYADLTQGLSQASAAGVKMAVAASNIVIAHSAHIDSKKPTAVSNPLDNNGDKVTPETWDKVYYNEGSQDDGVKVEVSEAQPAVDDAECAQQQHRVIDGDSGTEVTSGNPVELAPQVDKVDLQHAVATDVKPTQPNYRPDETIVIAVPEDTDMERDCEPLTLAGIFPEGKCPLFHEGVRDEKGNCKLDENGAPILKGILLSMSRQRSVPYGQKEIHFPKVHKCDQLKPGRYKVWLFSDDGTNSKCSASFVIDSLRNLTSFKKHTGLSTQLMYKLIANGTIKRENVVMRSRTCNKIRLYSSAVDDVLNAGHLPRLKSRAKLKKFLARRQPQA